MQLWHYEFLTGQPCQQLSALPALNSGLLHGQNPFTCFRQHNQHYVCLPEHMQRLQRSGQYVFGKRFPAWESIESCLTKHLEQARHIEGSFYWRVTMVAGQAADQFYVSIAREKLADQWILAPAVKLATCLLSRASYPWPEYVKLGRYAEAWREQALAREQGMDDVLFLDAQHAPQLSERALCLEASTSNIFLSDGQGRVKTPSLRPGVLGGIMRSKLIECLKQCQVNVCEGDVSWQDIIEAREVWLTNSIKGMIPVGQIDEKKFPEYAEIHALWDRFGSFLTETH